MNTNIINNSGAVDELFNNLHEMAIDRFDSIDDILYFKKNYHKEIENIQKQKIVEIHDEIFRLFQKKENLVNNYNNIRSDNIVKTNNKIHNLSTTISKSYDNIFIKLRNYINKWRLTRIQNSFDKIIEKPLKKYLLKIDKCEKRIKYLSDNQIDEIEFRSKPFIDEINSIIDVLQNLSPLIYGGIGELKAIDLFKNLPNEYYVINNYCETFKPPLYNKSENDRIYSTQIDHIIIGPTGVYVIETKYWSKKSINNYELFSPVKQLKRSGFALFVILNQFINADKNGSFSNRWGQMKLPVSNILLMMNAFTNEQFQFVKVLNETNLLNYITKRPVILNYNQVKYLVDIIT